MRGFLGARFVVVEMGFPEEARALLTLMAKRRVAADYSGLDEQALEDAQARLGDTERFVEMVRSACAPAFSPHDDP